MESAELRASNEGLEKAVAVPIKRADAIANFILAILLLRRHLGI